MAGRPGAVVLVALSVLGVASMADAQVSQSPPPVGPGFQAILSQDGLGAPDVSGAVGEDRVIATVNSRIRVQDKAGNAIGTEQSFSTFWGSPSVQHSRIVYAPDVVTPDDSLWVHAAVDTGNGRLLLAVFRGRQPDPSSANWGTWQKKTDLSLPPFVPDFLSVGFNRHWVVLVASSGTGESNLYVFDRAQLRDEAASGWAALQVFDVRALEGLASAAESPAPALTYDANEPDLYLVRVRDRSTGTVRLLRVTSASPPSSPVLQFVGESALPQGPWAGDIPNPNEEAPQIQTATPAFLVETGDDRVHSVVVDEAGDIWATNTVFLGGPRAAVQWWAARDDGSLLRSGRIDDATGRRFYAYPQIAVNANGDALVGYSSFSPTERVGASYSLLVRRSDGTYEQRGDRLLRAGSEVASYGTCSPCLSDWGRYNTVARDVAGPDFWTLQELPTFSVNPRWETWWGRVDPRPFITVSGATASEPSDGASPPGQARFKVALSWPSSQEVRVDLVTEDGSATAPADYGGISSLTLVLAPGETLRSVDVPVYYDGSCETAETFTLRLTNPVNAWLGETRVASLGATGTVLENPPPPTISILDVRVVERTGAGTWNLTVTVAASAEPCGVTTVDYGTREGSASSGTDFVSTNGSLTLGPGQASGQIDVPIFQDSVLEGDEQFYVDLSFPGAAYATLPRAHGVVTIRDDDDSGLYGQVEFLSITSDSQGTGPTSGRTRLRWRNPVRATTQHVHVRWQDDGTCPPGGGSSCTGACHDVVGATATGGSPETGAYDHVGLELGRTYCYVVYSGDLGGTISGANQTISGRPFDASGAVRWRFETNAGSSLGSPSIGKDSVLALMGNELHATVRDPAHADAGTWPVAWRPVRLDSLDQVRFPVLPVRGRWRAFIATNMGRVFSVDAETGALLWTRDLSAAPWSTQTGAPAAGLFRQYGGSRDLLFLGTRSTVATNSLLALEPFTGAVLQAYALAGTTGLVTTAPIVDYATRRVYFTSFDSSPTNPNLFCLQLNDSGAPFAGALWRITVPTATDGPPATTRDPLTTSPILRNGRIYVGDARGAVYSVRASDGGDIRRFDTGSGADVLGFLFPDRSSDALYFTTGDRVHKVIDSDAGGLVATGEGGWPISINPTATMPLFYRRQSLPGFAWTVAGDPSATRVFRIEDGSAAGVADLGVNDRPGQPTLDSAFGVMHIGTTAGSLFGVSVSLP